MTDKTIMIVDDDMDFLGEFSDILISSGYKVMSVSDSNEALEAACRIKPSLILLDLKMKYWSGFELASELRRRDETRDTPIVAMSGFYSDGKNGWLRGFCDIKDFLKKPFDPKEAVGRIEKILGLPGH